MVRRRTWGISCRDAKTARLHVDFFIGNPGVLLQLREMPVEELA
jgi:hypothetical protein